MHQPLPYHTIPKKKAKSPGISRGLLLDVGLDHQWLGTNEGTRTIKNDSRRIAEFNHAVDHIHDGQPAEVAEFVVRLRTDAVFLHRGRKRRLLVLHSKAKCGLVSKQVTIRLQTSRDTRRYKDRNQFVTTLAGGEGASAFSLTIAREFRLSLHLSVSVRLVVAGERWRDTSYISSLAIVSP